MRTKRFWISFWFIFVIGLTNGCVQSTLAREGGKQKGRISGRVLGADGKPLARVIMRISGRGAGREMVTTNKLGRYEVQIEPGTYRVYAERKGYVGAGYKLEESASEATPLTVETGQHLSNINFQLAKGGVITGRVPDENGDPLVGGQISVTLKQKQKNIGFYPGRFQTDDRGVYRIYGLPSGSYVVSVQLQEEKFVSVSGRRVHRSQPGQVSTYPGVKSLAEASEVVITEGEERAGIDFRLKSGPSESAKIFGRVIRRETGEPLAGTMIMAYQPDRLMNRFNVISDDEGSYEIESLPACPLEPISYC